jgi:hypothetical protein
MNKKSDGNEFSSVFIIPHYSNESEQNGKMFIAETVEGLFSQTDDDWRLGKDYTKFSIILALTLDVIPSFLLY